MRMTCCCRLLLLYTLVVALLASHAETYSVFDDESWAVRSTDISDPQLASVYQRFMDGCRESAGPEADRLCNRDEAYRLRMNAHQPSSVYNYTQTGFTKTKVPADLFKLIQDFWQTYQQDAVIEWSHASPYHNLWESPPKVVDINKHETVKELPAAIANTVRGLIESWTGMRQAVTSVYGIRIYYNQSILAPHVDRLPLVSSAIINVAQSVDTDWMLEVYDHTGVAHNVTMEPGDLVLYESHSIIHGRPFPLQGEFYANIFVHFEPIGPLEVQPGQETQFPPYLIPGMPWVEEEWKNDHPHGWPLLKEVPKLAQMGDLETLQYIGILDPPRLVAADHNGWQPIHDAARHGHLHIVKYLVEQHGVDVNTPTKIAALQTPLAVARRFLTPNHAVIEYLVENGAWDSIDANSEL